MTDPSLTAFFKNELLARGTPAEVLGAMRTVQPLHRADDLLVFDDDTGKQVLLDVRAMPEQPPRRGRPALGVEAREVTLLPRHWQWLAQQRGGASATLRKLVEQACKQGRPPAARYDAAWCFLNAIAGDLPHFEDAARELYNGSLDGYDRFTAAWPAAIREHGRRLAFGE
jgi:hypothetical protein